MTTQDTYKRYAQAVQDYQTTETMRSMYVRQILGDRTPEEIEELQSYIRACNVRLAECAKEVNSIISDLPWEDGLAKLLQLK